MSEAKQLCSECHKRISWTRNNEAPTAVLRALNLGPRTLRQLAIAAYGYDSSETRRKAGWVLKRHRDVVERVAPSTWQLIGWQQPEAAE